MVNNLILFTIDLITLNYDIVIILQIEIYSKPMNNAKIKKTPKDDDHLSLKDDDDEDVDEIDEAIDSNGLTTFGNETNQYDELDEYNLNMKARASLLNESSFSSSASLSSVLDENDCDVKVNPLLNKSIYLSRDLDLNNLTFDGVTLKK